MICSPTYLNLDNDHESFAYLDAHLCSARTLVALILKAQE